MPKTIKINAKAIKEIFEVFGKPDRMEFFYENGYNPEQDSEDDESWNNSQPDEKNDIEESTESKTQKLKIIWDFKESASYLIAE